MKTRKSSDLISVLKKKGFELNPDKGSHKFFYLVVDGKKSGINTFISHGSKDYSRQLMSQIKKQLKFTSNEQLDDFFDCPMSGEDYIKMLRDNQQI